MSKLSALPTVADKRVAVRVKSAAQRKIRQGHPWVFDGSVESVSHPGNPGDLAVIFDRNRDFLAVGLFDPASPIRVRILHSGSPRVIDQDFWLDRLTTALDRRAGLEADDMTTAFRLVNGEGDGFPGLVIDRYAADVVVKVYSQAWFAHLAGILEVLVALLGQCRSVVLRLGRDVQRGDTYGLHDGTALVGVVPAAPVVFLENGLLFEADVVAGQKTGHFLDQRDNRAMVRALAAGARVLDLFSCTGGFSVHAAAGGAREVVSVDQSRHALLATEHNIAANAAAIDRAGFRHRTVRGDAFDVLRDMGDRGERFDMVIIDPPSFAHRASQVDSALRAYARLTRSALHLLEPGDWLVQASCSSRVGADDFVAGVHGAAASEGWRLADEIVTGHAVDHPIAIAENSYLKAVFARAWPTAEGIEPT